MLEPNPVNVYQLRFFLKGISPLIWRRLLITNTSSLADLHSAIQISMGWTDEHLHQFNIWGRRYGLSRLGGVPFSDDARTVLLQDFQFRSNEKFSYKYNFCSNWEHEIRLEKVLSFEAKPSYPLCIGGHYAAPPEDCGGPKTFMRLLDQHTPWQLEEKLVEAAERYISEKDAATLVETLEKLIYWTHRPIIDRKKINRQLHHYFNHQHDNQLTIGALYNED